MPDPQPNPHAKSHKPSNSITFVVICVYFGERTKSWYELALSLKGIRVELGVSYYGCKPNPTLPKT